MFRLRAVWIGDTEEVCQLFTPDAVKESRLPPQPGGSDGKGSYGMSHVELAVSVGALAVLPRLPPVDGGEADEEGPLR